MNIPADLALFELRKLFEILACHQLQVMIPNWAWTGDDLGYADDAPRTASWVKKIFGMN